MLAADLLPLDSIRDEACRIQPLIDMETLSETCFPEMDLLLHRRQHLFSIYLHNPSDQPAFAPGHLFFQTEVPGRVPLMLGHQPRTMATKKLLEKALQEPLNQRFVCLSEKSIPIYPPQTIYRQLLSETYSRINACNTKVCCSWLPQNHFACDIALCTPRPDWCLPFLAARTPPPHP